MTYSIVARCQNTGQLGVAVQSHWFAAGTVCWAKSGVGAVATQAMALMDHGPLGLQLMQQGMSAIQALEQRLQEDESADIRQVAMIDSSGNVAAYTGAKTIPMACHVLGDGYSCQANLMWSPNVCKVMAQTFEASEGDLANCMLAALIAAEAEGGDLRGMQSGRILVVAAEPMEKSWEEVVVDIRVDDHKDPLGELRRLLDVHTAYSSLQEDAEGIQFDLSKAKQYTEIAFWMSIELANQGLEKEAKELANIALKEHAGWRELLFRCEQVGLVGVTKETLRILLDEAPLEND